MNRHLRKLLCFLGCHGKRDNLKFHYDATFGAAIYYCPHCDNIVKFYKRKTLYEAMQE